MTEINLEKLTTEETSHYDNLDKMSVNEILEGINNEDKTVPYAIEKAIPQIEALVSQIVPRMKGRWKTILHWCRYQWTFGRSGCFRMSAYFWCTLRYGGGFDCGR